MATNFIRVNLIIKNKIWLIATVLWLLIGFGLRSLDDDNFISDWINSAVAIGTIGAIVIALYINQLNQRDNIKLERRKALYVGSKLINLISKFDTMNEEDQKKFYDKLHEFQWKFFLIFNENDTLALNLFRIVRDLHLDVEQLRIDFLREYLINANPINEVIFDNLNYKSYPEYYNYYLNGKLINDDYYDKMTTLFINKQSELFTPTKEIYISKSRKILTS